MTGSVLRSMPRERSPVIRLPGVAAVVAAEQPVGGEVEAAREWGL